MSERPVPSAPPLSTGPRSLRPPAETAPGGRVLVADDQDALRRALTRVLQAAGYTVDGAADGRAAADLVATNAYDAVVSDIMMPGLDGIGLLRAVRAKDMDVPVVLMTGAPDVKSAADAVEYGALKYLVKPVDLRELEETVARAVRLYRLARAKREAFRLAGQETGAAADRAGLEAAFERALAGLWMAYQPIVRAEDRSLFGYEALLRSREPALPHPGAVLDAAERLDRLQELGRRVRATTALPLDRAPEGALFFVNLHARDLGDEELVSPGSPLAPYASRIVLEITERASLDPVDGARARVADLRGLGYRIAVDDLGAGYAGLTSFATLEPEIVKLDMSLVRGIDESPTKQKLVRSMTTLCRDLGMLVVGEGVETVAERDVLVGLGCDLLQGYLLAKPGPAFPGFGW